MKTILAIDDEASVRASYRMLLSGQYHVILAENGRVGLTELEKNHVDLILLDLMMPEMGGIEFLEEIARRGEDIPVVVVTATNSVSTAVSAMKSGAREYVIKPFDVDEILILVDRILAEHRDKIELSVLREAGLSGFEALVGEAPAFLDALEMARQAMQVDSTVLITGESGTGKDLIARAIHSGSLRAKQAFVAISCCAIPQHLVESELFGHEKGAFTGATERRLGKLQVADHGSIFLDEIGEMPIEAQSKLLRVLQDSRFYSVGSTKVVEVDIRVICATNRNLRDAITQGLFREDLYYRINVLPIELPPLRKRREDIPRLIAHFVAKHAPRINAKTVDFDPKAMSLLLGYSWPGNVRELENTIERILVCHRTKPVITADCLRGMLPTAPQEDIGSISEFEGLPLEEAVLRVERYLITRALERADHVQSRAAELLGTTRRILKYKMDQLGIDAGSDGEQETS
jgi:DNA-binding NtrC family response regulator